MQEYMQQYKTFYYKMIKNRNRELKYSSVIVLYLLFFCVVVCLFLFFVVVFCFVFYHYSVEMSEDLLTPRCLEPDRCASWRGPRSQGGGGQGMGEGGQEDYTTTSMILH